MRINSISRCLGRSIIVYEPPLDGSPRSLGFALFHADLAGDFQLPQDRAYALGFLVATEEVVDVGAAHAVLGSEPQGLHDLVSHLVAEALPEDQGRRVFRIV